mgnify:CR=1 FL=1
MPYTVDNTSKVTRKWLIGIDEVGRGPLAGPFTLCALAVPYVDHQKYFKKMCPHIRDSKKLSQEQRNEWNTIVRAAAKKGNLHFVVVSLSAQVIDAQGIGTVARLAVKRALDRLCTKLKTRRDLCDIRLDGSLFAPSEYPSQQTIIKGDEREPVISLASIVAKVHRDNYMKRLAKKYPAYGFEVHKGYGTAFHRNVLQKRSSTPAHRKSFLTKVFLFANFCISCIVLNLW